MQLSLAKSEIFDQTQCDFWQNENGDVFMTSEQLGSALEYANPRESVNKLVSRNEYLRENEFSDEVKLTSTDGKMYDTRVFTEDGIYEVTMLAKTPKAKEFRAWVRKILKGLRKGRLQIIQPSDTKQQELEIRRMNAESRLINARVRQAKLIIKLGDGKLLSPQSVELLNINAIEKLTDKQIDYRPEIEKVYSATDIAKEIGCSPNKVGSTANKNGLKTSEYGIEVLDKAKHSQKQVSTFRYNERGKQKLLALLMEGVKG